MKMLSIVTMIALTAAVSTADAQGRASAKKVRRSAKTSKAISNAMGDVRWGWSRVKVFKHHKAQIEASYEKPIAKATDAIEEDNLRHKMERQADKIRESFVKFDGNPTGHDAGILKDEFAHNNKESMLKVDTKTSEDFYFFHNNRLWKRYRTLKPSVFGGASFEEFGRALQKRYGRAKIKTADVGDGAKLKWYEWNDGRTRVRAIDNNPFYGLYCLVFEDVRAGNRIAKARRRNAPKVEKKASIVDMVVDDGKGVDDENADIADRISGKIRRKPKAKKGD